MAAQRPEKRRVEQNSREEKGKAMADPEEGKRKK